MISHAIKNPKLTLLITALICLVAAIGLPRLVLRTGGSALIPHADESVLFDAQQREIFGLRDTAVVVIQRAQGIFDPATLALIRDLSETLTTSLDLDEAHLISLATEPGGRFKPGKGFLPLLDPFPVDDSGLARLRSELANVALYDGILISADETASAILIGVPPESSGVPFYKRLRAIVAPFQQGEIQISIVGAPVAESLLGNHILADLGVPSAWLGLPSDQDSDRPFYRRIALVPIALLIMIAVFLICFRRLPTAMLPLLEVGCCLIITFGLMGWFNVPIFLTTAVLPVILTAVGVADEIHIFGHYRILAAEDPHRSDLVAATMADMAPPVLKTSLTTMVGFLSFMISPLEPVRYFGLFTALGVLICLLFSLTAIPALLVLLGPDRLLSNRSYKRPDRLPALIGAPRPMLLLLPILALFIFLGIRKLEVQDSWIHGFDPKSELGSAMSFFDQNFLGMHQLHLVVTGKTRHLKGELEAQYINHPTISLPLTPELAVLDPDVLLGDWIMLTRQDKKNAKYPWRGWVTEVRRTEDSLILTYSRRRGSPLASLHLEEGIGASYQISLEPMRDPDTLSHVEKLEEAFSGKPHIGGVLGPTSYLKAVQRMRSPGNPRADVLPRQPNLIRFAWNNYAAARGETQLRATVTPDYASCLVTLFLKDANYAATESLMADLRDYEQTQLLPVGLELGFAGDVAVSQALIRGVVRTQVSSLLLSFIGIFVIASLLGRSLRWGFYCSFPPVFAVALIFGVMGHFSIPLGVATSMFAGMTLGVGVDFAIHYLTFYDRGRKEGRNHKSSLFHALTHAGPAILIDGLAVGLGFGVLVLSQLAGNARLGGLLALSIFACLLATLFILPAIQSLFAARASSPST